VRILLQTDMEGVSWLTDHRGIWPVFPEYWRTGRPRLTADMVAAACALREQRGRRVADRMIPSRADPWPAVADCPAARWSQSPPQHSPLIHRTRPGSDREASR
jgi:hypothetical protein